METSGLQLALEPMRVWFVEGRGRAFQVREIMMEGREEGMSVDLGKASK